MISTKKQVQDLFKRLDKLDTKGIKVMLDMITDLDESNIYFTIKAVDRYNNVIKQETFTWPESIKMQSLCLWHRKGIQTAHLI